MYKYCTKYELDALRISIEYIKTIKKYMELGYKYKGNESFILPLLENERTLDEINFVAINELFILLNDSLGNNGDISENDYCEDIILENKLKIPYYEFYNGTIGISIIFNNNDIINLINSKKYINCNLNQFLMNMDLTNEATTDVDIQYAFNTEKKYLIIVIPQTVFYTYEICEIFRTCVDILEYIKKELKQL